MFRKGWKKIGLFTALLTAFLILTFSFKESLAQRGEYPSKIIKIIVTSAAGGLTDMGVRAWSDEAAKRLGVPVVIFNQAGGAGTLATAEASKAKPDGYTLLASSQAAMVVGPAINPNLPYDTARDFTPICTFGTTPQLIAVNSTAPFKNFEELLDYAKKNPGKLNCASPGVGTISHFDLELIKFYEKVDMVHVPFKSTPPALAAVLGNHVDVLFIPLPPIVGHLRAGRLRGLLTTTRLKEFPDIPLYSEKGLAQAGMASWAGVFAPAHIPTEIHKKLVETFEKVTKDPGVVKNLENVGYVSFYTGPEAVAKLMSEEFQKLSAIAKYAGIKQE